MSIHDCITPTQVSALSAGVAVELRATAVGDGYRGAPDLGHRAATVLTIRIPVYVRLKTAAWRRTGMAMGAVVGPCGVPVCAGTLCVHSRRHLLLVVRHGAHGRSLLARELQGALRHPRGWSRNVKKEARGRGAEGRGAATIARRAVGVSWLSCRTGVTRELSRRWLSAALLACAAQRMQSMMALMTTSESCCRADARVVLRRREGAIPADHVVEVGAAKG